MFDPLQPDVRKDRRTVMYMVSSDHDRIEDLEEGLRQVIIVLQADGHHDVTLRDEAALVIARSHLDAS